MKGLDDGETAGEYSGEEWKSGLQGFSIWLWRLFSSLVSHAPAFILVSSVPALASSFYALLLADGQVSLWNARLRSSVLGCKPIMGLAPPGKAANWRPLPIHYTGRPPHLFSRLPPFRFSTSAIQSIMTP